MKVQCQTIQPRINAKEKLIPGWHLEFQLHWNFEKIKASCKLCNLWELNKSSTCGNWTKVQLVGIEQSSKVSFNFDKFCRREKLEPTPIFQIQEVDRGKMQNKADRVQNMKFVHK